MNLFQNTVALVGMLMLFDLGYSIVSDEPPPPDETTAVAVEHMVYFVRARHIESIVVTNRGSAAVRAAVGAVNGEPFSGSSLVTQWRPISITGLLGGFLLHLCTTGLEMPKPGQVVLDPGESLTVVLKGSLRLSTVEVLLEGQSYEFGFEDR